MHEKEIETIIAAHTGNPKAAASAIIGALHADLGTNAMDLIYKPGKSW